MRKSDELYARSISDLGIDQPFVKGIDISIKNCWHFSTDGNRVDVIFRDDEDFTDGMNSVFIVSQKYAIIILAFCLMDTHVHFVLYGEFDQCNKFMHDYVKRISMNISFKYKDFHKLDGVGIDYQVVDTDYYLKIVICYVIKNAPVAGLPFIASDYPWSSGPLLFRSKGYWTDSSTIDEYINLSSMSLRGKNSQLKSHYDGDDLAKVINGMVYPGEYVAVDLCERIFKTHKSFNYFMSLSKEKEVEARGGTISLLSIPMQEMRQHKTEHCLELFGRKDIRGLDTFQRIRLAKVLRFKYNSSKKQIARLCGLVYDEVKTII